ncbi:hypothetical protein [Humisphaera borealis]|uniref:Uncharacterized protein n=1 Tax=Humisphaera borealis TaxID=2807512 RepID=A0A7M2X1S5_9BACT|nr:hypothetical protein [Humisphaera borealis]QOV91625.1 hypothetical protein IPV69_09785 [Humisphaera borealis]
MGLFEGKGQLDRATKDLMARWSVVRASWRDNVAADFEQQTLLPLQQHVKNATSAMSSAASLITRIKSEVSDRS